MENILINDTEKFDRGYLLTCDAVSKTLGGEGKLAILENLQHNLPPELTKDGVSVAERIRFADKFMNFGALQAIAAAARTLQKSGDSTTTCLTFCASFLRHIRRANFNKAVERGIEVGYKEIVEKIATLSKPVNRGILEKIAITSANNDTSLGVKILEAYDKVGYDGIVEVKKNFDSTEVEVITQNGMKIEKGYISPFFMNNQGKAIWEAKNALVVCLETWQSDDNIINFIKANRLDNDGELQPILFFMEKQNSDFIQKLLDLKEANHIDGCLVIAPDGHNELKATTNIKDLALFTGGKSYKPSGDKSIEIVAGRADSVIVDADKTLIVKDKVADEVVKTIKALKSQKEDTYTKERIQRLEGVSCLISVGGNSANDVNEKFDRVDDALSAVRSAVPEGYIAGGGSTLVFISNTMKQSFKNEDEQLGYDLIKFVINAPFKQILLNANREEPSDFRRLIGVKSYIESARKAYGRGYNAKTDEISNLIEDGVIDSAKSIRVALDSAKESAIKMLLTQVIITIP